MYAGRGDVWSCVGCGRLSVRDVKCHLVSHQVSAVSPAHGRTKEGRQGVPPGAVRVSVPCPLPYPHPQVFLTKSHVWKSVVALTAQTFAGTVHRFLIRFPMPEMGTEQCCWSVLWKLWHRGAFSARSSSLTKAELWLSSNWSVNRNVHCSWRGTVTFYHWKKSLPPYWLSV